ncbi:hypothetical protein ACHAQH_000090 [Verticillium albo-atrum]
MTLCRLFAFRMTPTGFYQASIPVRSSAIRPLLRKTIRQTRSYSASASASKPTPSSRIPSSTPINKPGTPPIPEHLLIYHAGTSRITFLALWKITSLFTFAFFTLIVAPSYARRAPQTPDPADPSAKQKTYLQSAGLALCGLIPLGYVAYTTAPFVTFIYLRLPHQARTSRQALERFVRAGVPASAQLELLTMGLATRPRSAITTLGGLRPVSKRLGIVNYERDVAALEAKRKWHQYRPVAQFGVRVANSKGVKDGWVWDAIKPLLGKTVRERQAS